MFLNILVAVDGSPSSQRALEHAVDLARSGNAKLTLMTVAPPVSSYVTLARVPPDAMAAELDKWASDVLADAVQSVPEEVLAHRVQAVGHAGPEILKELQRGAYDLVVVGTRGRGRAQEGVFGSVNAYLHFRAGIPILSVPDNSIQA
jgi:nucleotide-binding universal stress UspA family protein